MEVWGVLSSYTVRVTVVRPDSLVEGNSNNLVRGFTTWIKTGTEDIREEVCLRSG